jgi:hypothetical protein
MSREVQNAFRITGLISDDVLLVSDLDHALELCENAIVEAYQAPGNEAKSLQEWLIQVVGTEHAVPLAGECRRLEVAAGDIIARQGDPADSMHFILGLRGIEWVIFEVKVREKRGLQVDTAFRGMGYKAPGSAGGYYLRPR